MIKEAREMFPFIMFHKPVEYGLDFPTIRKIRSHNKWHINYDAAFGVRGITTREQERAYSKIIETNMKLPTNLRGKHV